MIARIAIVAVAAPLLLVLLGCASEAEAATNKAVSGSGSNNKRVVCYYTNWSAYRPGQAKFLPQNINPYLCTHLIYAFGGFTNDFSLRPFDKWQDIDQGGYSKFNGLKAHNKNLRTLLAIGGWNEGSQRFSKLVADPDARQNLVKSSIKYLRQHNFDGLDLDWEYPASRDGSREADRENYALLVKELREGFNKEKGNREKLLLTMAVPAGIDTVEKGYDIRSLNRDLDFINILSYDYHTSNEPQVNHHAPLRARSNLEDDDFDPNEGLDVDATVQLYLLNGASADKLVVGIPTYGRAFKLVDADQSELGSPAEGPAEAGKATREQGYLAYYEICEKIAKDDWTVDRPDPDAVGPYAWSSSTREWVGYDDEDTVARKANFVNDNQLGGIMFWSIDNDDFRGTCTGRKYPLIEAAKAALLGIPLPEITSQPSTQSNRIGSSSDSSKSTTTSNALIRPTKGGSSSNKGRITPAPTVTTTSRSNSGDSNSFTTPEPPTTPDSIPDFECTEEGFYPNPRDCKKYFWCLESGAAGMVSHIFTCPSGLFFNTFTDSCDYATNVICKTSTTTTTVKPLLSSTTATVKTTTTTTTTTTPKPTTQRTTKPRVSTVISRSTTTKPEPAEFEDDEEAIDEEGAESPEELQQLLQLISDLGGVDAVKKLLEKNAGRGRKQDGQQVRLSSAQRLALERVIRPGSSNSSDSITNSTDEKSSHKKNYVSISREKGVDAESIVNETTSATASATSSELPVSSNNTRQNAIATKLQLHRPAARVPKFADLTTTTTTTTTARSARPAGLFAQGSRRPSSTTTVATTTTSTTTASPKRDEEEEEAEDILLEGDQEELVIEDDEEELIEDDLPPLPTTTTTTTSKPTTTNRLNRLTATRRRPLNSQLATSGSTAIPIITSTPARAAIVIAIPAPLTRPIGDDFQKTSPSVAPSSAPSRQKQQPQSTLKRPQFSAEQDDIDGSAEVIQGSPVGSNSAGNVVEIDEDGRVFCYDVGNFAYPEDCRKFVQCARPGDHEPIQGWVHTCPRALSFDPVGAICNWGSPVRCRQQS